MDEEIKRTIDTSLTRVRALVNDSELGKRIETAIARSDVAELPPQLPPNTKLAGGRDEAEAELRFLVSYLQNCLDRVRKLAPTSKEKSQLVKRVDDRTYCSCHRPSFGEMVACDNPDCKIEWFHTSCVGLKELPRGLWYCPDCRKILGL